MKIIEKIKNIHKSSRMTYGYRRVHVELKENMEDINHKKVARLMRENNIFSKRRIKFKVTTKAAKKAVNIDNVLNRNFVTNAPNKVWVSDITYIKTKQGWVYLCIIIDLFSRRIVGWECSDRINNELVLHTFLKAYWQRKPQKGLMFHSDRGSQYTSNDLKKVLRNLEVTQSLSRKANCLDNAVAESCFHTIKQELGRSFTSRDVANSMIFEYIEAFYNSYRRHSFLNYYSPNNFEMLYYGLYENVA